MPHLAFGLSALPKLPQAVPKIIKRLFDPAQLVALRVNLDLLPTAPASDPSSIAHLLQSGFLAGSTPAAFRVDLVTHELLAESRHEFFLLLRSRAPSPQAPSPLLSSLPYRGGRCPHPPTRGVAVTGRRSARRRAVQRWGASATSPRFHTLPQAGQLLSPTGVRPGARGDPRPASSYQGPTRCEYGANQCLSRNTATASRIPI